MIKINTSSEVPGVPSTGGGSCSPGVPAPFQLCKYLQIARPRNSPGFTLNKRKFPCMPPPLAISEINYSPEPLTCWVTLKGHKALWEASLLCALFPTPFVSVTPTTISASQMHCVLFSTQRLIFGIISFIGLFAYSSWSPENRDLPALFVSESLVLKKMPGT